MSQYDPSAVATADQWRAELRELVNRVRLHRLGCPDEGAGYICVGRGIADHINHHLDDDDARGLLITALYEIAGRDAR